MLGVEIIDIKVNAVQNACTVSLTRFAIGFRENSFEENGYAWVDGWSEGS